MDAYLSRLSALQDDVFKKHSIYARKVSLGYRPWSKCLFYKCLNVMFLLLGCLC